MQHRYIGKTGLRVSPICLRTMTFGTQDKRQRLMAQRFMNERTLVSTEQYLQIAQKAGIHPVTLAIAWSKQFDFVASTIMGVTTIEQLEPIFEAMDLVLSDEVLAECDRLHEEILYPMGQGL